MPKKFYADMQKIAGQTLSKFDQSQGTGNQNDGLWYVKITPGNGPKDNPGAPGEAFHKLEGVAKGVPFKFIDGTNILATDMQCTVAIDANFEPDMKGAILKDGKRYKILAIRPIPPVGIPVVNAIIFGDRK